MQSFGAYHFDLSAYAEVDSLFHDAKFQHAAKTVCPDDKQHLDPFQFNFIIQVPGQTVSNHIDGVYFWGASRFQFPQWLLAAMKFSGLWEDKFVDQVQVVGYLHEWTPPEEDSANANLEGDDHGSFVYWSTQSPTPNVVLPVPLSGSVVDGSKTAHAASVYRMAADLPFIDKSKQHWLRHLPAGADQHNNYGQWTLSNKHDGVLRNYTFDDLRISIVYRARCFEDAAEAARFRAQLQGKDGEAGRMALDDVLSRFVDDFHNPGLDPAFYPVAGFPSRATPNGAPFAERPGVPARLGGGPIPERVQFRGDLRVGLAPDLPGGHIATPFDSGGLNNWRRGTGISPSLTPRQSRSTNPGRGRLGLVTLCPYRVRYCQGGVTIAAASSSSKYPNR